MAGRRADRFDASAGRIRAPARARHRVAAAATVAALATPLLAQAATAPVAGLSLPVVQLGLLALALGLGILVWRLVTKRREQEIRLMAEIREREARLNLALWGSGDEFWDWNIRENSLYRLGANQLFGQGTLETMSTDEWRSQSLHPEDLPRVQKLLQEHIVGHTEQFDSEHRIRGVNGDWVWVRSRGKVVERDEAGSPLRMAGTARDITAIRRAERERRVALEVLRSMSEAVGVIDLDFRFISVNPSFSRITGYSEEEVLGLSSSLLDSTQHSPDFYRRVREILERTGHWAGEMWQRRKDDEEFLGWIEMSEVRDTLGVRSHFVAVVNDITDKKRAEQELRYLANYDTLTGLPNRALLSERLGRAIVRARRQETRVAVLFLDLDRFKDINDSLGHAAGDRLLKAAATRLQATVSASDTVARLGGDEFTVVLEDVESLAAVERMAREILLAFASPLDLDERHDVSITPSLGISLYPDHALVPTDLLKFADTAMYQAKGVGRNTYQIYNETMDAEARHRAAIISALRKALDRGEFHLVYQPRMSLSDGSITGVEALLRWSSPELGDISPTVFVPLAEESGLILGIGDWVIREACAQLAAWRTLGLVDLSMGINVSVLQLLRGHLSEELDALLRSLQLPPDRIELELTESMVMQNAQQATALLNALRLVGVSLAIDDFGTGYSSLVYLKRLPIDTLKIDKEFVDDLTRDPDDEAITSTIITMGHSLGLNVIAEGVETEDQLEFLREHGCDEVQGHWLSRPLEAARCLEFIRQWQPDAIRPAAAVSGL
jgi:diguanylate cyclase (GGDEF)-like protein/PAS domain S-box-containing protein